MELHSTTRSVQRHISQRLPDLHPLHCTRGGGACCWQPRIIPLPTILQHYAVCKDSKQISCKDIIRSVPKNNASATLPRHANSAVQTLAADVELPTAAGGTYSARACNFASCWKRATAPRLLVLAWQPTRPHLPLKALQANCERSGSFDISRQVTS